MLAKWQTWRTTTRPPSAIWVIAALVLGVVLAVSPLPVALVLVVGVVGAGAVLREPLVGIAGMLLLGPWGAVEALFFDLGPLDSGQLLFFGVIALWLGQGLVRHRIYLPKVRLLIPLILFIIIGLITLRRAPAYMVTIREVIKWVEIGVLMVVVIDLVESAGFAQRLSYQWRVRLIAGIILLAGLSQGILGFWQFAIWNTGPEHFRIFGNYFRAFGSFQQPNPFGGFVGLNFALALGILIGQVWEKWGKLDWLNSLPEKIWLGFIIEATLFLGLAVIGSWSRGAWLGMIVALPVLIFFGAGRYRWQGVALLGMGGLLFLVGVQLGVLPEAFADRLVQGADFFTVTDVRGVTVTPENYSTLERLAHWQAAIEMGKENIWLGVGFGNYEPAYAQFQQGVWDEPLGHAHNYYLNLIGEVGVIGLLGYLLFWGVVFGQCLKLIWQLDWADKGIALGLLAAWTAFSVHHLVDKLYVNNVYLHIGVMLALQQLLVRGRNHNKL